MSKSRNEWLLIALAFVFIAIACVALCFEEDIIKAVDTAEKPYSQEQDEVQNDKKKININTASKKELSKIKGLGKDKAQKIVEFRKEHGEFLTTDELLEVEGIGTKTYIKIKDKICV